MIRFVLDEHLRGPLWSAIEQHNRRGGLPIDVVRVGDSVDLPLGIEDPDLLKRALLDGRILVTEDVHTMPVHLANHLLTEGGSPGFLVLRSGTSIPQIVDLLELIAHAGQPEDYENAITYIP